MSNVLHYLVAAHRCEADELERLSRTCELVLAASELVHCLQQERGMSNIFLASGGERFGVPRQERIAASDAAQEVFRTWLASAEAVNGFSGGARLYTRIAFALHALDGLARVRADVTALSCTPAVNSVRYQQLVSALLALVFEAADVAVDPEISRRLIALFHLMQGKEFAGRERATGAAAFAAGQVSAEQVQAIEDHIDMQEQAFRRFESFAEDLRAQWQVMQSSLPLADLERMRRKLLTAHGRPLDDDLADAWYVACSRRMDGLHQVETHLAGMLQQRCREKTHALRQELSDQEQMFASLPDADALAPLAAFASRLAPDNIVAGIWEGEGEATWESTQRENAKQESAVGPHLTQAVVDMLRSQSERLRNVTEELATVRASLEERKLIERAKGILMMRQGLNEESAYRLLRQHAMNQNRRIAEVAQSVLSLAEILPGTA